jgi:diguanylate cyclase (GGDEF)-like protein
MPSRKQAAGHLRRLWQQGAPYGISYAVAFALIAAISLAVIVALSIWSARQQQLQEKESATQSMAQALISHAQASLKQADIALFGLVERLETDGMGPAQLMRLERLLQAQKMQLPQLHGLFIYDRDGRWLINSNLADSSKANNSDRGYFVYHRDHPAVGPYIGPPLRSRSTNDWILTVSRRINTPDGDFAGVALATISLNYFLKLYESIDIGQNGALSLMLADGTLLVRRPFSDAEVGISIAGGELFRKHLHTAAAGTANVHSSIDGVERVVGFASVSDYPLSLYVARDKGEILAKWRREATVTVVLFMLLIAVMLGLGYRLMKIMEHRVRAQNRLFHAQASLVAANRRLELLAREDGLTGLANRRQFDLTLDTEFARAKRNGTSIALLMMDVDHFKHFNDRYGHLAGDDCLKCIAGVIRSGISRETDLAARYGGEEFAAILPDTDMAGALAVADAIRAAAVQANIEHALSSWGRVTLSIGVAAWVPPAGASPAMLISGADKALYRAKDSGRNVTVSASAGIPT